MRTIKIIRKIGIVFLAAFICFASIFVLLPLESKANEKNVYLSVGTDYLYPESWRDGVNWGSPIFWIDGSTAYCGISSLPAPKEGTRTAYSLNGDNQNVIKALYRGYGGPASVFKYDSSVKALGLDEISQYLISHAILSYVYSNDMYGFNNTGEPHRIFQTVYNAMMTKPLPKYLEYEACVIGGEHIWQDILSMTGAKLTVPLGTITLNKRDSEKGTTTRAGASVEGAEYTLYAAEAIYGGFESSVVYKANEEISKKTLSTGQVFGDTGTQKINSDGQIVWDNLPEGKYYIKETKAAKGFNISNEIYNATLTDVKKTITCPEINATDNIIKFNLKIKKTLQKPEYEEDDVPVKNGVGCKFQIRGASGEIIKEVITDEKGQAEVKNLPYDDYEIREIEIPEDYIKDGYACDLVWNISKKDITQGKTFEFKGENRLKTGKMAITKIANDSKLVIARAGTEFEIYNWRHELINMKDKDMLITDGRGICVVKYNMPVGTYYLKEKKAPNGYSLNQEEVEFTIKENKASAVDFYDDVQKFIVKFQKVGSDDKIIAGARFEIKAAQDIKTPDGIIRAKKGEKVCEMASDLNGNVVSSKLFPGKYILTELETTKGYQLLNDNLLINVEKIDQDESLYVCDLGKIENKYVPVNPKKKEVKPIPKTNAPIFAVWIALFIAALGVICFLLIRKLRGHGQNR